MAFPININTYRRGDLRIALCGHIDKKISLIKKILKMQKKVLTLKLKF